MKRTVKNSKSEGTEMAAKRIAEFILNIQAQAAGYLTRKTKDVPAKSLAIILSVLGSLFGGYCLYLILTAIINYY